MESRLGFCKNRRRQVRRKKVGANFGTPASIVRSHCCGKNLRPADIPYAEAGRIYVAAAKHFQIDNAQLPLTEAQFRKSLTNENMIQSAQVIGGPQQPSEVARMLAAQRSSLTSDREWLDSTRGKLDTAAQ